MHGGGGGRIIGQRGCEGEGVDDAVEQVVRLGFLAAAEASERGQRRAVDARQQRVDVFGVFPVPESLLRSACGRHPARN